MEQQISKLRAYLDLTSLKTNILRTWRRENIAIYPGKHLYFLLAKTLNC